MNLFLVPASKDNIGRSISRSVDSRPLEENLTRPQVAEIREVCGNDQSVRCWAMSQSNRSTFSRMQPGHIVVFTVKGTAKFNYMAVIAVTMECPKEFGNILWPFIPNAPWALVYFLRDVTPVDIEKRRLVAELGYRPAFRVPKAILVEPERLKRLTGFYGPLTADIGAIQRGELP